MSLEVHTAQTASALSFVHSCLEEVVPDLPSDRDAAPNPGQDEIEPDAREAMLHLRRACRGWTAIELPLELAQTRLLLSRAYSVQGNADEADLEERAARTARDSIRAGTLRR